MTDCVELHQAFTWDCPECGRENFTRAVMADLPREEHDAHVRKLLQLEPGDEVPQGALLMAPEQVTCAHCRETFDATDQEEASGG